MKTRNQNATCSTCAYYIPMHDGKPSECRARQPIPLLVPMMVPIPGSPIMVSGKNGSSGPQMKQVLSAEFPMFSPMPDFWCGQHPDFWQITPERVQPLLREVAMPAA